MKLLQYFLSPIDSRDGGHRWILYHYAVPRDCQSAPGAAAAVADVAAV